MTWNLYDFTNERGDSLIEEWIEREKLSRRDVGQLNQKLGSAGHCGFLPTPKLLAGPIYKHIYKLKIHGQRMLRPFLCRGPFNMDTEFTLLLGAIEANGKLDHDPKEAENNRNILLSRPTGRGAMNGISDALRTELLDPEYSEGYAESFLNSYVATQIKVIREQRQMKQAVLAREIGTTRNRHFAH